MPAAVVSLEVRCPARSAPRVAAARCVTSCSPPVCSPRASPRAPYPGGELALPERRIAVGTAVGVGGTGGVRLFGADSLRVGAASARGITVCALDLRALRAVGPEVRGLLGLNFLRSFRVTLDFEREVLRLTRPAD